MQARRFITVGGDLAYLLVTGTLGQRAVLGVLVGVSLPEAERAAELESVARAARTGRYQGAEPFPPEQLTVSVEVSNVLDPPPPDVGQVVVGTETVSLPVGSIIQPVPPDVDAAMPEPPGPGFRPPPPLSLPPAPPLLRTAGGWLSTADLAWENEMEPIVPNASIRFLVVFRAPEVAQ